MTPGATPPAPAFESPRRRGRVGHLLRAFGPGLLIIGGTLALCLHLWGLMQQTHEAEMERARSNAEQRASHLAEAVQHELDASLRSLELTLGSLTDLYDNRPRDFARVARQVLAAYPHELLLRVAVYGPDGRVLQAIGASPADDGLPEKHLALRHADADDRMAIGPTRSAGARDGEAYVLVSRPLRRKDALVAVVGIAVRPQALSRQLAALHGRPQDALALFRPDGHAIAHSRASQAVNLQVPMDRPFLRAGQGQSGIFRTASAQDGRPLLMAWRRLPRWSLAVVAAINEEAEYAALRLQQAQAARHAGGLAALALCFAAGVVLLIGRLQHIEARSTAMFRRARLPVLLVDPMQHCVVEANDAAAAFYGHPRRAMAGMPLARFQLPVAPAADAGGSASSAQPEPWRDGTRLRHWRADGVARDVEIRCGTLPLGDRTLLYCTVQDITERCAAETAAAFQSARLAALLDTATDGIHILDEEGRLVLHSPSFRAMLGYSDDEARELNLLDWDVDRTVKDLKETIRRRMVEPRNFEARHRRKDGTLLDVEIASRGFTIGGQRYLYASSRDITERKLAEQQLRLAAATFEAQEGIVVTDQHNVVLRVNRAFTEITGYTAEEMIGRTPSLLASGRHDAAFYAGMWRCIHREGHWKGEIYNRRKNGEIYPEWLTITAVRSADGHITHHIGMLTDITERKAAEREVRQLAFFDPLTQLPNRRLLYDRLKHALARADKARQGAALFIDLDDFKTLNDTRGHATGDRLLQLVAQRLRGCVHEDDTVARIGGDEFVLLLENIGKGEEEAEGRAREIARRIHAALERPYALDGQPEHSTASIGIALFDGCGDGVDETLKRADLAMYEAKSKGRNGMRLFDPRMQAGAATRVRLEAELRTALQEDELVLFFQPQVDRDGRICGAETLVRWQHPQRGLLPPGEFIEVAERAGLIGALGVAVLEGACARLVSWSRQPALRDLKLAVNVSALQFADENFVEEVRRVLRETGADPHRLELELTESALVEDLEAVIAKMGALKALGIDLALDDFGTGYSSLAYLSRLPLDQLKIDRSFVKDIEVDPHAVVICAATINLAHSLSLKVVAEGVETEVQRQMLTQAHPCDRMQGYLFGRPVPASAFEASVLATTQTVDADAGRSQGPGTDPADRPAPAPQRSPERAFEI